MLIRFAVENYNSFKERQIFSMVAGKQTRHPSHCVTVNGKRLLKSSFFFGANASGKSNFVRALDFMRRVTLIGVKAIRYNDRFFRIDSKYKEKPGIFQIDFIVENIVFSYGFAINYLTREFCTEWLYRLDSSGKETCIFDRKQGETIITGLQLNKISKLRFNIYCEDLKADELLLYEIGNKKLDKDSALYDFIVAYEWFKNLIVVYPDSHTHNKNDFFLNPTFDTDSMIDMLRAFDTGIEKITKGKQPAEKAFSFLPEQVKNDILDDIEQTMKDNLQNQARCKIEIGNYQFEISIENGEIFAEKIMLNHGNPKELFELSDESDGTKRLFDLIPLYEFGQKGKIIVIDELDRSFHSKLTEEYIKRFFEITKEHSCQLICTTHDLNLMDLQILRQDEIWFVERESDHSTRIYSLSDYKQRFDKNILNDYLIGRYGAIPYFQDNEWQVNDK
ncbi:AAA family ATPase [Pilosibacter fragilis]|uniref:AAA family ATPase n=1 Tax=Pilosibacter fragilis TaxID=3078042 RepID=UPI0032D50800